MYKQAHIDSIISGQSNTIGTKRKKPTRLLAGGQKSVTSSLINDELMMLGITDISLTSTNCNPNSGNIRINEVAPKIQVIPANGNRLAYQMISEEKFEPRFLLKNVK